MNLAIIPARSGSKRIKNKNIIDFYGKPIISYSIKIAINSKLFDKVIVSTDSLKIQKIANKYGAETPFLRPKNLSGDKVPTSKVIKHAINFFNNNKEQFFDNICCIYPVAPLIRIESLVRCLKLLKCKGTDYAFPVSEYPHPIQRSFQIYKNNFLKMSQSKYYSSNSNNLTVYYHDTGQFYWGTKNAWMKEKKVFSKFSKIIKIPNYLGIDVDTFDDLEHLKMIYKNLFNG